MPKLRNYHLFLSHSWKYHGHYYGIYNLLKEKPLFNFKNFSIPNHNPLDTKGNKDLDFELIKRMKRCHVAIFLGGMYANYSKWMIKELKHAKKLNIPIIVLVPQGQLNVPRQLQNYADEIINWNSNSLINSIRRLSR